jgi:DNA polymerase-3 subunit alpha
MGVNESFVHLHVHTEFSLLEASTRVKALIEKTEALGMSSVAITDNGNMFGAVEFYLAAKAKGINGIIGLDAYIAPNGRLVKQDDRNSGNKQMNRRIVLLAENYEGYQNLCQISSIGYQEGFYYKPRIDYEVLEKYSKNLIALSGGLRGDIAITYFDHGAEKAIEQIKYYQKIFPNSYYLEMQRPGIDLGIGKWKEYNQFLVEASKTTGAPLVATNEVFYLENADSFSQEVLMCIGTNKTLQDESRLKLGSDQFYFKPAEQMRTLFKDYPEACDNTLVIADRCKVNFKLKDEAGKPIYHLPSFPTAEGRTLREEIKQKSLEGLLERFEQLKNHKLEVSEDLKPSYYDRLDFELNVIHDMGFSGYFMIVQDFINWAKNNGIPVGPGRGSGAGSLVAYALNITDLDPISNKLIFERFLNPERVSMPDFDIDFCQERRGEVINYVTNKYGAPSVSQIITFGKLQARAAIRDVGRVMGMSFQEVDVLSKLMPDKLGVTLEDALTLEPRIQELMDQDSRMANLFEIARKIEGIHRHASIHAAGVVISNLPLVSYAPLYKGAEGENVVQYDMKVSEKIGLIKFDFLGLKTLTHIDNALKLIQKNRGKTFKPSDIAMNDAGIYDLMTRGDTAGVFQFEGGGMTETLKRVKPTCFEDIVAVNSLYRPGPMDMIPEYIARKHGLVKVSYIFDELEEILKETYGIIVYQEQVQLIASKIASYSLGEADLLRRAMGKKIKAEMDQQRERFMEGAHKNGHDVKKSGELFDLMAKFAEYGFNKSHAAAYCVIAGHTAWIKNYYPVEFYAALLNTELSDTDKVVKYIKDARKHNIMVKPPDVNFSEHGFTVKDEDVFFGLGAIKGVGQSAVEAILEARATKPNEKFESLSDFFMSVDLRRVNKKVMESLIKAGAFDNFGIHRAKLYGGFEKFIERSESERNDREMGQSSLFNMIEEEKTSAEIELPETAAWTKSARLNCEKEVLGFYLSEHPLNGLENVFDKVVTHEIAALEKVEHKKRVIVGGILSALKEIITRKGTRMAILTLEDLSSTIEVVVFPDLYVTAETMIKSDQPLVLEAVLEKTEESYKIIAEKVYSLEERMRKASQIKISMKAQDMNIEPLKEIFKKHPGSSKVYFECLLNDLNKKVMFEVEDVAGVQLSQKFFEEIQVHYSDTSFIHIM